MNGAHDMGGMHGFGPVQDEPETDRFHGEWEKRAFALTLACGGLGQWTIDQARYARERQPPVRYLENTYYEQWLHGLETLLVEKGLVTPDELRTGKPSGPPPPGIKALPAERVVKALQQGSPYTRPVDHPPGFAVGDRVRVRMDQPVTHTRAPRYVRGRTGTVVLYHGGHVFADASARGDHGVADHLYNVAFDSAELWGIQAQPGAVHLDLWEPYLVPA
ncbi:MAG: nitrile hydratase subunit beta [Thalassobaculum sp.]|uniref:nitrile hydratase subunit beta n=1 Tax=Thalassobaculum sp. TaxID=2022740 RepID=UPI0032F06149